MKPVLIFLTSLCSYVFASQIPLQSRIVEFGETKDPEAIVLHNDSYEEAGGPAYVQMGFVAGEMAGIWAQVPHNVQYFRPEYFRVLMASGMSEQQDKEIFFRMGIAEQPAPSVSNQIENAARIKTGPFWNDIPAQGLSGPLPCAQKGQYVGGAVEFTHDGLPSVFRDADGMSNLRLNVLFAKPGGWNYSGVYGLTGDWILRIVGRRATKKECER